MRRLNIVTCFSLPMTCSSLKGNAASATGWLSGCLEKEDYTGEKGLQTIPAVMIPNTEVIKQHCSVLKILFNRNLSRQGSVYPCSSCFDWILYFIFKTNLACKLNPNLISFHKAASSLFSPSLTPLYSFPCCSDTIKNVLIKNSQYYQSLQHNYQFTEKATTKIWKVHNNVISICLFLYLPTSITHHLSMSLLFLVVVPLDFPALW